MNLLRNLDKRILNLFISSFVILIVSLTLNFVIPYFFSIEDYGYYKLFTFYTSFTIYLNLGVLDGVYLIYGKHNMDQLPRNEIASITKFLLLLTTFLSIIGFLLALILFEGSRSSILMLVSINILLQNLFSYFNNLSQITTQFNLLAVQQALNKVLFLVLVLLAIFIELEIIWVMYFYLFSFLISIVFYLFHYRDILICESLGYKSIKPILQQVFSKGFILMIANSTAIIIISIDRVFVDIYFDIEDFSLYSFAASLIAIIIVLSASMAKFLYPILERSSSSLKENIYNKLTDIIFLLSVLLIPSVFIIEVLINLFLPDYIESVDLLFVMFFIVIIRSDILFVKKGFIETFKLQNRYLIVNLVIVLIAVLLNYSAIKIFDSTYAIVIASFLAFVIWSLTMEIFMQKNIGYSTDLSKIVVLVLMFLGTDFLRGLKIVLFMKLILYLLLLASILFVFRRKTYLLLRRSKI